MVEYIGRLRNKPEHVRRRIALGASYALTGLVAAGWLVASVSTGMFDLSSKGSTVAAPEFPDLASSYEEATSGFSNLMGAAGAANTSGEVPNDPALVIMEGENTSTVEQKQEAQAQPEGTVIPF